jgi:hypothetical protein
MRALMRMLATLYRGLMRGLIMTAIVRLIRHGDTPVYPLFACIVRTAYAHGSTGKAQGCFSCVISRRWRRQFDRVEPGSAGALLRENRRSVTYQRSTAIAHGNRSRRRAVTVTGIYFEL